MNPTSLNQTRHRGTRLLLAAILGLTAIMGSSGPATAQEADEVTLDRLFGSGDFFPDRFGPARWIEDGRYTTVERTRAGMELAAYDAVSGAREVLVSAADLTPTGGRPLAIHDYFWSDDASRLLIFTNSQRVWRANTRGDYWVLDLESGALRQIGTERPEASLMFAKFSPDGSRVGYVSRNDIFVEDLESGAVTRLTEDGSRTIINGTFDWVYEEEFFLQDGFRWSPDGSSIAYWQLDAEGVGEFLMINNTDSLYSYTIPVQYPKAGTTNSAGRVGVVPADGGSTNWIDLPGDPRQNYIVRMEWAANSGEIVLQYLNRRQDRLQVMLADASTGEARTILDERDEAWVDVRDDFRWLDEGSAFTWVSERDGWRRAYRVSRDGGTIIPLTPPDADILAVEALDEDGGWIYFTASPEDPIRQYLYRSALDGSGRTEQLSPARPGYHEYQVSGDGAWAFYTFSRFDDPPTTSLVSLPSHREVRTLVDNATLKATVERLGRTPTEFFRLEVEPGVELDGWVMKPNDFDPDHEYPVLFYVYGEPWGATVRDRWGGTTLLWHHLLTQKGYLVVSFDNRGTPAPRGREWRKIIHGQVGVHASRDQANAAQKLPERFPFVDSDRLAIWGWSGGGSQTLNSLFRYPGVFSTGMAVAPVPDQRYYDTAYQERYSGIPQENPDGYRLGSPITYAHQLEGNLLLVHGTGDDNVHYQGTEALINRLIEAGKHFTMMAYPNRSHGIFEGRGTTRHVYGLLTRYLEENVPAGPRESSRPVSDGP
jgi:dipeptidyl-peptidase-4